MGFDEDEAESMAEHADALPNLQLLEGAAHKEKLPALPADWLAKHKPAVAARADYCDRHLLGTVPDDPNGFDAWFTTRRKQMSVRLKEVLGA